MYPKLKGADMKADKTAEGIDASSIPGEFRENYRFLSELINCEDKNNTATKTLEQLVKRRINLAANALNRRQTRILNEFIATLKDRDAEPWSPPVPAELEAYIRIRKRSTWLPWEAEAIRKIEKWRGDVLHITQQRTDEPPIVAKTRTRKRAVSPSQ
jgi:hypothetical protein